MERTDVSAGRDTKATFLLSDVCSYGNGIVGHVEETIQPATKPTARRDRLGTDGFSKEDATLVVLVVSTTHLCCQTVSKNISAVEDTRTNLAPV